MSSARDTASSADVASPSPGTGMPYASATRLASGALSASRPSARTSSSTSRTVAWSRAVPVRSCVVVEAIKLPLLEFWSVGQSVSVGSGAPDSSDGAGLGEAAEVVLLVVQELLQNLGVVLAQQRRALDLDRRVREREGAADGGEAPAVGVLDVDDHALRAQPLVLEQVLRAQHGAARDVDRVELAERLPLGLRERPLLDAREDVVQARQARLGRGVVGVLDQLGVPDLVHQGLPDLRLDDDVEPRVLAVVGHRLAAHGPPGLAAAGRVAGARDEVEELLVRVLLERPVLEALLVAQLDAAEVEDAAAHRDLDALAAARVGPLVERGADRAEQVDRVARVADLRAGDDRRAVLEAGRAHRAAGRLGDVLVGLGVLERTRPEALQRRVDQPRVELVQVLPGEAEPVHDARAEVLDQDVGAVHELAEDLLALVRLHVEGEAPLVAVEHREVQRVHVRQIAQLAAGHVAAAGLLDLDDVGSHPREELRADRAGLHVRHVEDADALEGLRNGHRGALLLVHRLVHGSRRERVRVHPHVDQRRLAALAGALDRRADLARLGDLLAVAAEHLGELAVAGVRQLVADVAAALAVLLDLAVADLVHVRVVADDADERQVEAHGGVEVEAGEAERAVAEQAHDLTVGVGLLGADAERHADADRSERARIHPQAGALRLHDAAGERDDVAAVADAPRVLGEGLVDLVREAQRVDRGRVLHEARQPLLLEALLLGAQLVEPALAGLALAAALGRLGDLAQDRARVADE